MAYMWLLEKRQEAAGTWRDDFYSLPLSLALLRSARAACGLCSPPLQPSIVAAWLALSLPGSTGKTSEMSLRTGCT